MKTDIENLKDSDIVKWCRLQAKKYEQIARYLEADVVVTAPSINGINHGPTAPMLGNLNADSIRAALTKKSARVSQLATAYGVPESTIERIVDDPASKIERGSRGWLKVAA